MLLCIILLTTLTTQIHTTHCETRSENIIVDSNTSRFIDSHGRECTFHGLNAVYKPPPYVPISPNATWAIDESTVLKFKAYGVNILRLGLMYAGAMPQKGEISDEYFDAIESILEICQKNGVYVLLDSHQDLFTDNVTYGDGFPAWSAIQGNARDFPYPLPTDLGWSAYYMTEFVNAAFGYFYNNTEGLQDYYAQFWAEAGRRFAKYPNVIGYELLNEPWPGDVYEQFLISFPAKAYRQNLAPLYDKLSKAIRAEDPDHLIFFESVTWDYRDSGIEHVPGGAEYANKTVLSYHFYVPPQTDANYTLRDKFEFRSKHKCGSMLTEFEIWNGETDSFKRMLELADVWGESWIGWIGNPLSILSFSTSFLSTFAHPYAQIIAGHVIKMEFEPNSREFVLSYLTDPKIGSNETVIFVNKALHYPNDFSIDSTPSDGVNFTRLDKNYQILVTHSEELSRNATQIKILIAPNEGLLDI